MQPSGFRPGRSASRLYPDPVTLLVGVWPGSGRPGPPVWFSRPPGSAPVFSNALRPFYLVCMRAPRVSPGFSTGILGEWPSSTESTNSHFSGVPGAVRTGAPGNVFSRLERAPGRCRSADRRGSSMPRLGRQVIYIFQAGMNFGIVLCRIEYHDMQGGGYVLSGFRRRRSISIPL